ncbi:MAG: hypothetical protein BWY67_00726 [Bacteroidetes bacterium ADurb.Bin397]|nr:MAG: hypothetical protein BWY67_00726 [Bacteroidetes bacterium ADurb.Bin397]
MAPELAVSVVVVPGQIMNPADEVIVVEGNVRTNVVLITVSAGQPK